jgi:hypothetical protein
MENNFYASMGDVHTNIVWGRPNLIKLEAWWNEWKQVDGIDDYEIYLSGAFAEQLWGNYKGLTWDVDIIMIGKLKNSKELKHIMDEGYHIGWNNRLCMDIIHSSDLHCGINKDFKPYSFIRNGSKFTKNRFGELSEVSFADRADEINYLDDGLVQLNYNKPSKLWNKVQSRLKTGEYIGTYRAFYENIFS